MWKAQPTELAYVLHGLESKEELKGFGMSGVEGVWGSKGFQGLGGFREVPARAPLYTISGGKRRSIRSFKHCSKLGAQNCTCNCPDRPQPPPNRFLSVPRCGLVLRLFKL